MRRPDDSSLTPGQSARVRKEAEGKESYSAHVAASAKRYVEKRFLRDLYAKWKSLNTELDGE
jgi:hypothetical protein